MRLILLALLVLSLPFVMGALSEEHYGTNLARIYAQAEVNWMRDNVNIVYDFEAHKNLYVSSLSDMRLTHILKHPKSREAMGITEEKVAPYLKKQKIREGLIMNETETPENKTVNKTLEQPIQIKPLFNCVKHFTYDPFNIRNVPVSILKFTKLGPYHCT